MKCQVRSQFIISLEPLIDKCYEKCYIGSSVCKGTNNAERVTPKEACRTEHQS